MRIMTTLAAAALILGLGACADMSRSQRNTAVGAAVGGVAGSVLTNGSVLGTVGGRGGRGGNWQRNQQAALNPFDLSKNQPDGHLMCVVPVFRNG